MGNWENYLVKGIDLKGGSPASRKEIRELSAIELVLFREGLAKFQNERVWDDPKSFFQIAGIHGMPYTTWPNQDWNKDIPHKTDRNKGMDGFCTHSSILFLTWHRPYLSLFETTLYEHVQDFVKGIADSDPQKKAYVDAAKSFRLPYWDWARRDQSAVFPTVALENVYDRSTVPKSTTSWFERNGSTSVYNPLYQYRFPDKTDPRLQYPRGSQVTTRHPGAGAAARQRLEKAVRDFALDPVSASDMSGASRNLSERTAYVLLAYKRFGPMSYNALFDGPTDSQGRPVKAEVWGSLEDTHNSLHGLVGNRGHMNYPTVAAFDPIFWLHHANIDRLFAIWQALNENDTNPDAWVTAQRAGDSSWNTLVNDEERPDTFLYPFRPTEDSWYDSKNSSGKTSVKRTEPFGYTYPETAGLQYPVSRSARQALYNRIQSYYTNAPRMIRQSKSRVQTAGDFLLPQAKILSTIAETKVTANHEEAAQIAAAMPAPEVLLQESVAPGKPFLRDLAPENNYLEWLINVKAQRHALGGNYAVHFFLNAVEENDVSVWHLSPHYVGAFNPFGQTSDTPCGNCQNQQEAHLEITGQIPLTVALIERYLAQLIPDLTEQTVVPYLTKNLHWRVESNGQALADRSQVDGLTVFVVSNKVTLPENEDELPIYDQNVTIHPEITTNLGGQGRGNGTGLTAGQP